MWAGVAFQIIDDVLDIVGNRGEVRKTLGRDFSLGKATLPTIHCLASANTATRSHLRAAITGETPVDADHLRGWLLETGSIEYAVSTAEHYVADALEQLNLLAPSDARTSLTAMAEFIVHRRF
jgi:geranylgeranyl pyrophosphate synthase